MGVRKGREGGGARLWRGTPLLSSDITPQSETWWKLAAATRLPTGRAAEKSLFFPAASRSITPVVPASDVGGQRRTDIRVACESPSSSETMSNLSMALFGQTDKANQGGTCRLVPPAHNLISRRRRRCRGKGERG